MTAARANLQALNTYIREHIVDINAIGGVEWDRTKDKDYDWKQMQIFYVVIILSLVPPLLVWLIR
jgi:hypothetical protein